MLNNLFYKYEIFLRVKKLKAYKYKLKNKWTLWFHNINDNNWTLSSYIKLYSCFNIAQFWGLFNNHYELNKGMFFFMKDDINPIYEDKRNISGGYWSMKVSLDDAKNMWTNLCIDLVSGNLDNFKIINGLTISYKKKFYIIKIWINNDKYNNINNINISQYFKKNDIIYNKFIN